MNKEPKRVWFIGAGFTAAVGYPLGGALVTEIVRYLRLDHENVLKTAPHWIRSQFENSLENSTYDKARLAILNDIETFAKQFLAVKLDELQGVHVAEFYSIAQALAEQDIFRRTPDVRPARVRAAPRNGLRHLYYNLAAITRSFFVDICHAVGAAWPADFKSVLKGLQPENDTIVNFNWDEEVDYYLTMKRDDKVNKTEFNVAYTAESMQENHFLNLKPHGSIGWYDITQAVDNAPIYFVADHNDVRIERFEKRLIAFQEFELPRDINDGPGDGEGEFLHTCPPAITPPTFGKQFKYREQSLIWQDVIDKCRHADEFIFLGYSLPPDDFLTRAAIRCALDERKSTAEKKGRKAPIRCLILAKAELNKRQVEERVIHDFGGVFPKALSSKNVLTWTIGAEHEDNNLFEAIIDKLQGATVKTR
jgi:hypothetical protein